MKSTRLSRKERWISFSEILLGSLIVIGHNVFHVLPNEVPILFVIFWISLWLRGGRETGLKRPESWLKLVAMAVFAAVVLQLGNELVIQPLASHIWHRPEHISSLLKTPAHDWKLGLRNLGIVWLFGGFGEELSYRGYPQLPSRGRMDSYFFLGRSSVTKCDTLGQFRWSPIRESARNEITN